MCDFCFQVEDGIRGYKVTGVQTCALPIYSYKNDPVCRMVRWLVNSGIVVVAAAGNDGKDATHAKLYGRIHSPGNEPSALKIGRASCRERVVRVEVRRGGNDKNRRCRER